MKQANINAEWMALITLTHGTNEEISSYMLSKLKLGHFGIDFTQPLFSTITTIAAKTGACPSFPILQVTPGINSIHLESLGQFASNNRPITSLPDAQQLIGLLDTFRKGRLVTATGNATLAEISGDIPDFDKVVKNTQAMLLGMADEEDDNPIWHFGKDGNAQELYNAVMLGEKAQGIPTGFKSFDSRTGGHKRGNFNGMASHYKGGKSLVAYNMGMEQYRLGYNVLFIPFEMKAEESMERHMASIAGVPYSSIQTKSLSTYELKQAFKSFMEFMELGEKNGNRFSVKSMSSSTPADIISRFKGFKYDVIYLDYLKLMEPSGDRKYSGEAQRLDDMGSQLKKAATEMNVVLWGLAQMDEETEKLRYSKALLEHANNVWQWKYKEAERATSMITVNQSAARSWEPFDFHLKTDFKHARVVEAAPEADRMLHDFNKEMTMEGMFNGG